MITPSIDQIRQARWLTEQQAKELEKYVTCVSHRRRDSQRSRLYEAERSVHRSHTTLRSSSNASTPGVVAIVPTKLGGQTFSSIEEQQEYVDRLLRSAWFRRRFPNVNITVREVHRRSCTCECLGGNDFRLNMSRWGWFEAVLLHEIAHSVTKGDQHGPLFASALLEFYWHRLGPKAHSALKQSFAKRRVHWTRLNWIAARTAIRSFTTDFPVIHATWTGNPPIVTIGTTTTGTTRNST